MLTKIKAIFVRDARLQATYRLSFVLHWFGIAAAVAGLYFMARLFGSSRHLMVGGMPYFDYALINVAFLTLEYSALEGCEKVVRNDQVFGTLPSILATPTSLGIVAVGSALFSFAFAGAQIVCYLAFGALFGLRIDHVAPLTLIAFVLLAIAATVPLGVLSTAMVIVFKQGAPVQFVLRNAAVILAGVLFPVSLLPNWMQPFSWMLPATHVLNGVRGAFNGAGLDRLAPDALWLAGAALVLFPCALIAFRSAVAQAKFDGALSHY